MKDFKNHVIRAARRICLTTSIITINNHFLHFIFIFLLFFILPSTKAIEENNVTNPKVVSSSTPTEVIEPTIFTSLSVALMAAGVTLIFIIIIIICFFFFYRNCFQDKAEENFVKGLYQEGRESAYVPIFVERKMAQSAQMFFYQFQKQQLIAQEREKKRNSVDSCSDTENNEKDGAVMSCPGLALHNGETIEVRNPLFMEEDVSASPGWYTTTPPSNLSTNNNSADEIKRERSSPLASSRPPSSNRPNTPSEDTADNTSLSNKHAVSNTNVNNIDDNNHSELLPDNNNHSELLPDDNNHSELLPDDNNNKIPMKVIMKENKYALN